MANRKLHDQQSPAPLDLSANWVRVPCILASHHPGAEEYMRRLAPAGPFGSQKYGQMSCTSCLALDCTLCGARPHSKVFCVYQARDTVMPRHVGQILQRPVPEAEGAIPNRQGSARSAGEGNFRCSIRTHPANFGWTHESRLPDR